MKCFLLSTPAGLKTAANAFNREMDWGDVSISQDNWYFSVETVRVHRFEEDNLELSVSRYHYEEDDASDMSISTRLFVTLPSNESICTTGELKHCIDLTTFSSLLYRLKHNDLKEVEIGRILIEKMATAERRVHLSVIDEWKTIIQQTLFFINEEKLNILRIEAFTDPVRTPQGLRSGGTFIIDCQIPQ